MAEVLRPQPASDAMGFLSGSLGLRLDEVFLPLKSLSAAPKVLDTILEFGQVQQNDGVLLLRLWPDVIWASGAHPDSAVHVTDIGHGTTHFRLRGVEALHFLANYTRVDLFAAKFRQTRAIRTSVNHYDCVIWWSNTRDIHLLVDRSVAQSFADHLQALAQRHDATDPHTLPRPVAPDAPDRRG
jgi:hypothetical protein